MTAGLATAIAGVVVASPALTQQQLHLPSVSSASMELASAVSSASAHAVAGTVIDAEQIGAAVRHIAESVPGGATTTATGIAGGALIKDAAVTALATAVREVAAVNSHD